MTYFHAAHLSSFFLIFADKYLVLSLDYLQFALVWVTAVLSVFGNSFLKLFKIYLQNPESEKENYLKINLKSLYFYKFFKIYLFK